MIEVQILALLCAGTRDAFRQACALFHSVDDAETYARLEKHFPGLRNYDERGNYVGAVSNENGWSH